MNYPSLTPPVLRHMSDRTHFTNEGLFSPESISWMNTDRGIHDLPVWILRIVFFLEGSFPLVWTLRSVTSKISSQRHCFPARGFEHHLVSSAQSVLQLRYLTQKNQSTQVEKGWSQSRQPREHLIAQLPGPAGGLGTPPPQAQNREGGGGWQQLQRMCWARASPAPPTGGNTHTILE